MGTEVPIWVMEPPPGEVRTEVNPPSTGGGIIPAAMATTVIALVVVVLRIYTRAFMMRGLLGIDDYLVIIAMVLSIAFAGFSVHLKNLGCGLHMWDMKYADYTPPYLATTMGITMTYCTSVSFAKLSILVFYLRLSPERKFRIGVYSLIALTATYTVVYIVVILLVCRPVELNWDLSIQGECFSRMAPMMTLSVANIVIDFAILLIPVHVVVPLQMPRRQKISLIFLFATGGFVCAAAIYRTYILPGLLTAVDYTWVNPPQNVWGSIEANAGIVCASVPALKPFFMKYFPFLIASRLRSGDVSHPSDFNAYSTTAERNRKRRLDKSYELSSRDHNAPNNSFPADPDGDDEARLWPQNSTGKAGLPGEAVTTVHESNSLDSVSPPNESSSTPWTPGGPHVDITASGRPVRGPSAGGRGDIHVTKETRITYN